MINKTGLIFNFLTILSCVFFVSLTAIGQKTPAMQKDLLIADKQADCVGLTPQKCLVVREINSPDWKYLYSPINGFKFRDGYTQKIRVFVAPRKNPPADDFAMNYRIIKVLSSSKTNGDTLEEAEAQIKNQKPLLLYAQKWILTEIDDGKAQTDAAFIQFDARAKRFNAKVCNSIGGSFVQTGNSLKFSNIFSTKMACREPLNSTETKFQNALEKVTRAAQESETLTLFAGETQILKFKAAVVANENKNLENASFQNRPLEGTKWVVSALGSDKVMPKGNLPFVQLDKQKMSYAGFAGCNKFFGEFEQTGGLLKFGTMGMTKMACVDPDKQTLELKMIAALTKVTRYEIERNVLKFYAGDELLLKLLSLGK